MYVVAIASVNLEWDSERNPAPLLQRIVGPFSSREEAASWLETPGARRAADVLGKEFSAAFNTEPIGVFWIGTIHAPGSWET